MAEEVRKLASESENSTERIKDILGKIQKDVGLAAMEMRNLRHYYNYRKILFYKALFLF